MAYSIKADFWKRIKKSEYDKLVAISSGDALTTDDILNEAIATADSVINSYLQNVISTLPIGTPPKSIVQASVDIAIYNLHSRIQYIDIPEWITVRYNIVIKWLQDLSKGMASLESSALDGETSTGGVTYETDRNIFGSDTF